MKRFSLFLLTSVLVVGVIMLFSLPAVSSADKIAEIEKCLEQREDVEKAKKGVALAQEVLEKDPKNEKVFYLGSRLAVYAAMDLATNPDTEMDSYEYMGIAGELTDAWLKVNPDGVAPNFWKAYSAAAAKDIKTALSYGEKAYKTDPKYFSGMPALVLGYLKGLLPPFLGGDKVQAYKLIDEAMEAAPDNLMIHRVKAMLLVNDIKADSQKALVHLQFVLESPPSKGWEGEAKRDKAVAGGLMKAYGDALKGMSK